MLDRDTMLHMTELFMGLDSDVINEANDAIASRELMLELMRSTTSFNGDCISLFCKEKAKDFDKNFAGVFLCMMRFYLMAPTDLQLRLREQLDEEMKALDKEVGLRTKVED